MVVGGPEVSFRPSDHVTSRAAPRFDSPRACQPDTVTTSPGFIETSFFHPWRISMFGGYPSNRHCATEPSGFFTSTRKWMCGLVQSILRTVPLTVIGLLESYSAANEWWAVARVAPASR